MERRAALAIGLSLLVLYLYQAFVLRPQTPPPTEQAKASAPAKPSDTATVGSSSLNPVEAPSPNASVAAVTTEATERSVTIDNGKVVATISNRGGALLSWRLKGYLDEKRQPLDLIPSNLPDSQPRALTLKLSDPAQTQRANTALYRITGDAGGTVDAAKAPATITLEYEDADGLRVKKEIHFEPQSYVLTVNVSVNQRDQVVTPAIQWGPGLGDAGAMHAGGSFFTGNYVQPPSAIYSIASKVTRIMSTKAADTPVHEGQFLFAGIDDHYFLVAAIDPGQSRIEYQPVTITGPGDTQHQFLAQTFTPAKDRPTLRLFVGPKQLETLRAVGINGELAYAINFGMFKLLVIPLLGALKWLHQSIGNYGWSIVTLTIIINLVMFPLRHKSLVSMRKLQAIQPQIKAIQDRYADLKVTDPARQKMNTEVMNLYREKGVNPAAGCVPMLLTMPVLFAFYSMLSQAIELRGADFGFWIHDLSLRDPFFVTPLLMGATMFWQQWMTPTTADPMQQRMMMFMPLVLTGVFLQLPSGLAIYYLVSNLCQIGQQYITNRTMGKPTSAMTTKAPGDRRMKSAGGGKSAGATGLKQGERRA